MQYINVYNDNSKLRSVIYQNSCVLNDLLVVYLQYYTLPLVSVKRNLLQASILTENSYTNQLINKIGLNQNQCNNVQKSFCISKTEGKRGSESIAQVTAK